MSKTPFLYRFASKLNEAPVDIPTIHFNSDKQMNVFEDGSFCWKGVTRKTYTNIHTVGHNVPAHRTPSGKWVPAKNVKGKTDRRVGH